MLELNLEEFDKLQGDMTDIDMAKKLEISRTQLWRIKNKKTSVGQKFIAAFMRAYPEEKINKFFLTENVAFPEHNEHKI
ncbi:hypothetical protein [Tissierella praeacuta]|uniref:hypothetical protein n=1 Tax=Tissierella praeacuta TaxID=43131 RepID=UPI0028B1C140|nr:hypothetical protein [Tissierella praeacuta]